MNNKNCELTSSGMVYSYNIPKEYKSTCTTSVSCYKEAKNYGSCKAAQIVPPSPTTVLPSIFNYLTPHPFKNKIIPTTASFPTREYNRDYNNGAGNGPYGSQGGNTNTCDVYRKISMPNSALSCGGLGKDIYVNHFKPGFNDVSYY